MPTACPTRRKRATDQECAPGICPPTSFEFFQAGVFDLGLDAEHAPCHGGVAVKDVRIPKLFDDPRVKGAHRVKVGDVSLERGDAHAGSAQFLDQRDGYVMLREVMQREMHAARSQEARCRLPNTAPVRR